MLAGQSVDGFASAHGIPERSLLAPGAREAWLRWQRDPRSVDQSRDSGFRPRDDGKNATGALYGADMDDENRWRHHDTIGVLAMKADGEMAGACSTSGTPFKQPGRVGDSPIIGHGLFVEPKVGMAVGTGEGEFLMGACGAYAAVEAMRGGLSPLDAALRVLERIDGLFDLEEHHQVAMITCDASGNYAAVALRSGFRAVVGDSDGVRVIEPDRVLHSGT
jgi:isoaspartyl peptidase/L-asparaginase-like protein (Ntn-hydrolase superfamily)